MVAAEMIAILGLSSSAAISSYFITPYVKNFLEDSGIIGIDQQKRGKPAMATSAGIVLWLSCWLAISLIVFIHKFTLNLGISVEKIFAATISIFLAAFVGLLDDLNLRSRRVKQVRYGIKEYRVGLKPWQKPLLTLPAAVPLLVVRAGATVMHVPFIGQVDFGIVYNLILVPIAFLCVTNAYNFLAGMNGLESGLGLVAFLALGSFAIIHQEWTSAAIAFSTFFSILGFIKYNWYPAKFLPGDSLTYMLGASYASTVIIGNMEKFGIMVFTPWIVEAFLKLRSKFSARSLGILQKDGTLKPPYGKEIYSLTHLAMNLRPMKEEEVTLFLIGIEIVIVALSLSLSILGVV